MPVRLLATILVSLCAAACGDTSHPVRAFALSLHARVPEGRVLAGVRFWADGREIGVSDANGALRTSIEGREGGHARIAGICPPGYTGDEAPRLLPLRAFVPAEGNRTLVLNVVCTPQERLAAVVVRAHISHKPLRVPVLIDGQRAGETDADGVAHLLAHASPTGSVRVSLDTSAFPHVLPRDPAQVFEADASESILLFDPQLRAKPPRARQRMPKPEPRELSMPYRIE